MPSVLDEYFVGVKKGCSSNSYIAIVKWDRKDELMDALKRKLADFEGFEDLFYRGTYGACRLIYYAKSGRLLVESPDDVDVQSMLEEVLSGPTNANSSPSPSPSAPSTLST